jgi:tetratricopeptide (TPR) repeat protein
MRILPGIFRFFQKLLHIRKTRREKPDPNALVYERWNADFTKPARARFDIKSDFSYDAYVRNGSLALALKKPNCLAWVEDFQYRYADQIIEGNIRLDPRGAYAAAGFIFRMVDDDTYYAALVSSKGYFRLDVLRNGNPQTLAGWTEIPQAASGDQAASTAPVTSFGLKIIANGNHIALIINGLWAAEVWDSTIPSGRLGFALASYEAAPLGPAYAAEAFLDSFTVESRIEEVEAAAETGEKADGLSRFHLAETFAAMGQPEAALVQLRKAWDTPGYRQTPRELLLACRLALSLNRAEEAEDYAASCIAAGENTPEGKEALIEKAKIFYITRRFDELKALAEASSLLPGNAAVPALLGHAYFELKDYEKAAEAYDRAFALDGENGLLAKNAANIYELLDRKDAALERYLSAGRVFLTSGNYDDLGTLVPRLSALGGENWQARALAGKWAFGVEDWAMADREFTLAEELRQKAEARRDEAGETPQGEDFFREDPAMIFLRGMLLLRDGKRAEAQGFLEKAAALAPDYPLFRFKLAENRFLLSADPNDPAFVADLEAALALDGEDGWTANLAAQAALSKGDLDAAERHLQTAVRSLGDIPAVKVNQGVLYYLRGSPDKALAILTVPRADDPEGLMANCAGNLLVRDSRYEEADTHYRRALAAAPKNTEFLCNRASCLIELGLYGEADDTLAQAYTGGPTPLIYELIAYVATKKGEYPRAEAACRAALDLDPCHIPSLLSLGWMYAAQHRWDDAGEILRRLDIPALSAAAAPRREELRAALEEATTRLIPCAVCGRTWRVPLSPPPAKPFRLYAMPPDELPAGTCPQCGAAYCIGCAKQNLDESGRFLCPACRKPLKLINEGLKKIVGDWLSANP